MTDHYHPDDHPDFTRMSTDNPEAARLWTADLINRMVNVERKLRAPMWAIQQGKPRPVYTAEDLFVLANELTIPTPVRESLGLPVVAPDAGTDLTAAEDQDGTGGSAPA